MTPIDEDFLRVALDFFDDYPATGYYQKPSQGAYDPATGEYTTVIIEIPVRIIIQDLSRNSNGLSYDFGTTILAGDKACTMLPPEVDVVPQSMIIDTVADRLRVNTTIYRIENMKEYNIDGSTPILYQLMLRR